MPHVQESEAFHQARDDYWKKTHTIRSSMESVLIPKIVYLLLTSILYVYIHSSPGRMLLNDKSDFVHHNFKKS